MVDILINPNIAYLLLVGGFLLTIIAILTPGTGMLEVSALFALVLAGWQVLNLEINLWALLILLLGVFPFYIAVRRSKQLIYLTISIAALIVGSSYLFQGEDWWLPAVNPLLAILVSILSAGFLWIITVKTLEAEAATPSHDLTVIIGATGEAKTVIDLHGQGSVQVYGELWTARSEVEIPAGTIIRVTGREGFLLEVEAIEDV